MERPQPAEAHREGAAGRGWAATGWAGGVKEMDKLQERWRDETSGGPREQEIGREGRPRNGTEAHERTERRGKENRA
jgi:hypothetical protein